MRNDIVDGKFDRPTFRNLLRLQVDNRVLTGNITIGKENAPLINLDPGGAGRNVDFPAPDSELEGAIFVINNWADAAEDLTIRNSAAATILTISQNEAGVVFYANGITYGRLWGALT